MKKLNFDFKPGQVLVLGFIMIILIGAFLLTLPFSSADGESVGFIDALFTSTSAVCVTGLATLTTYSQWTIFGKVVIIVLIQVGGLGFMSFITAILLMLGKRITLKERILIKESFNLNTFHGMVIFLKRIIVATLFLEILGGICLSLVFIPELGFEKGLAFGMFHSVSAFCNAGFDIIGEQSVCGYSGNIFFNIVLIILIFSGGIGFTVLIELYEGIKSLICDKLGFKIVLNRFSLHTKLALMVSVVLIVVGWILIFVVEYSNPDTIGEFGVGHKLIASLFQSVSLRTAGFASIPQDGLTDAGKIIGIMLMAIGGSTGGTAGGIKTVTFSIILIAVISVIKGRKNMVAFKRTISLYVLQKALTIVVMFVFVVLLSTLLLTITESGSNFEFIDLLYEVVSAMATVGFTANITPSLTVFGKIILIVCMFIGRLGPITVAATLASKGGSTKNTIEYPEGKILVG